MRLSIFLIVLSSIQVLAVDGMAQNQRISLKAKNVTMTEVLDRIENTSNYLFFYNNKVVDLDKKVSVDLTDKTINEVLDVLFVESEIEYTIKDRQIILSKKNGFLNSGQQQKTVTGKVTDSSGLPLPGVAVLVKGTTKGIVTDFDGNYTLPEVPEDGILVFSFVGMRTQEVSIAGQTLINISMVEDAIGIEEVVAIGYGTMKKSDITGALSSVTSADFEKQPINNAVQALQGRSAGVQVTQTSGGPAGVFKVRIRGANSLKGSNDPLYVVDGVPSGIGSVSATDIKSIEILKDASATAIYGSRGANGVILVTTKDGKRGGVKINFDSYYTVSNLAKKLDIMNGYDFAKSVNEFETAGGGFPVFTNGQLEELRISGGTDWQDEIFQTGGLSHSQLSISGGTEKMDFYVSAGFQDFDGILVSKNTQLYTFLTKINANLGNKVTVGVNLSSKGTSSEGPGGASLNSALTYAPSAKVFDENGEIIRDSRNFNPEINGGTWFPAGTGSSNPLLGTVANVSDNRSNSFRGNAYIDYKITKDLVFNSLIALSISNTNNNSYRLRKYHGEGEAKLINKYSSGYINTNRLSYNKQINSKHKIQLDAIYELSKNVYNEVENNASRFFTDNVTFKQIELAELQTAKNSSYSSSLSSYVGRLNYSFSDKYLLTASVRADGSSKFQKDKWGIFPSGSLAWRMSEEGFMQDIDLISNLKLRTSYGVTGSQAINALATWEKPLLGVEYNYPFTGGAYTIGVAPSARIANPDLTWETTEQINVGLDFGLYSSKIYGSFDWYKKNTTDLLLDVTFPAYVGANEIVQNIGEVENRGFEFSIGAIVVDNNDLTISSDFNLSRNINEVISLVDGSPIELGKEYFLSTLPVPPTRVEVGKPISSFRGYEFLGVYQLGEEADAAAFGRRVGDAKYKDQLTVDTDGDGIADAGDGVISTEDITTVGDGNADFIWGLNTTVSYKKFDFNVLIQGSHGNDVYNFTRGRQMNLGAGTWHAVHEDYKNRWTPTNPSNIPAYRDGTQILSSQFIEDGSFVKVRNVSVSYTLDNSSLLNKLGVGSVRLYATSENLFVFTKYSGFDPETSVTGDSDVDLGIDFNAYPQARSFTLGLNINF